MQLPQPFLANQVTPAGQSDLIVPPLAWYELMITDEVATESTKNKNSGLLKLVLTIRQGQLAGKKLGVNLNIWNENPKAVEIAYGELSSIVHALGTHSSGAAWKDIPLTDTKMIQGVPFMGYYGPQEDEPIYGKLYKARKMGDPTAVNPALVIPAITPNPVPQFGQQVQPPSPFVAPASHIGNTFNAPQPTTPVFSGAANPAAFAPGAAIASPSNAPGVPPWQQKR